MPQLRSGAARRGWNGRRLEVSVPGRARAGGVDAPFGVRRPDGLVLSTHQASSAEQVRSGPGGCERGVDMEGGRVRDHHRDRPGRKGHLQTFVTGQVPVQSRERAASSPTDGEVRVAQGSEVTEVPLPDRAQPASRIVPARGRRATRLGRSSSRGEAMYAPISNEERWLLREFRVTHARPMRGARRGRPHRAPVPISVEPYGMSNPSRSPGTGTPPSVTTARNVACPVVVLIR